MKKLFSFASACLFALALNAQTTTPAKTTSTDDAALTVVEASCGQCNFGLKGNGCNIAVRMGDKAYYADGVDKKSIGDEHGKDGICIVVRKAKVKGEVVGDRFVATHFELLPVEEKK